MEIDEVVELLDKDEDVGESYVLIREIKAYLEVGHSVYHPDIKIKIYKSSAIEREPYHFEVSHHAHTPSQATPYYPSHTSASTEKEAIKQAIDTTTSFIKSAISKGLEPEDEWLVPNERF